MMQALGVRYALAWSGSEADRKLATDPDYQRISAEEIFCRVNEYRLAKPFYRWGQAGVGETVELLKREPERREFEVDSPQGGRFVLVEQFFPGWRPAVDVAVVEIARGRRVSVGGGWARASPACV